MQRCHFRFIKTENIFDSCHRSLKRRILDSAKCQFDIDNNRLKKKYRLGEKKKLSIKSRLTASDWREKSSLTMSSRVLRKLQSEKEKDLVENDNISDIEIDTPVGGARKKQLNMNRYDLVRL